MVGVVCLKYSSFHKIIWGRWLGAPDLQVSAFIVLYKQFFLIILLLPVSYKMLSNVGKGYILKLIFKPITYKIEPFSFRMNRRNCDEPSSAIFKTSDFQNV